MKLARFERARSIVNYIVCGIIIFIIFDVILFRSILGYGYHWRYEDEKLLRNPTPYVMFSGKPGYRDHNEFGFRGLPLKEADPADFKIAFFGGSTGYGGNPPIPSIVEEELSRLLNRKVFVANYSVVSSHHRQHLHGIIEYIMDDKPDLVIFYGGYNENILGLSLDPRPGYPYNYFYRAETRPIIKVLLENSALAGEIDKAFGLFTDLHKLKKEYQPTSDAWKTKTLNKYFETLERASQVSSSIASSNCRRTKFLAFYQPFNVPEVFRLTHEKIKDRLGKTPYAFDVSNAFDSLGDSIYKDVAHVKQEAKEVMGQKIASIVAEELLSGRLKCNN